MDIDATLLAKDECIGIETRIGRGERPCRDRSSATELDPIASHAAVDVNQRGADSNGACRC